MYLEGPFFLYRIDVDQLCQLECHTTVQTHINDSLKYILGNDESLLILNNLEITGNNAVGGLAFTLSFMMPHWIQS